MRFRKGVSEQFTAGYEPDVLGVGPRPGGAPAPGNVGGGPVPYSSYPTGQEANDPSEKLIPINRHRSAVRPTTTSGRFPTGHLLNLTGDPARLISEPKQCLPERRCARHLQIRFDDNFGSWVESIKQS